MRRWPLALALSLVAALAAAWPARDLAPLGSIAGARAATLYLGRPAVQEEEADLTTGLVVYYPLNSASGYACSAGNPGATLNLNGATCGADYLSFDGGDFPNASPTASQSLASATKAAFAGWVYFTNTASATEHIYALSTGTSTVYRFYVRRSSTGYLTVAWSDGANEGTTTSASATTDAIPSATWKLITVNWDSTTDTVQGWVDSTQVINYSGAFGAFGSATSGRVRLGSSLSATPTFMLTGRELRFRLFSGRALNAADRAAMLADGHP